ncbi:MAG: alanine--glyoxylate aminotransferase family protein [Anaerolineae bacterium]|nr:alanine--glyoxylate aminotransferase family protein [Anaerolineae bacterium]
MSRTLEVRVPGPTPLPPEVRAALSRPMVSHRSREFRELLSSLDRRLRPLIGTPDEVVFLTTSGTGGLEAAVANTVEAGDRVLSVCTGYFGERFAEIARRYGASVDYLRFEPGQPADPATVRDRLEANEYRAVLVTHCETSTGVLNDVVALAQVVRQAPTKPLLLLDAVSSLGAVPFDMNAIGADIVVTASQKAWMTPPGLAMLALSPPAWSRVENCATPRLYFDLLAARDSARRGETPWTPALTLLYGLDVALDLIADEGPQAVFARHQALARLVRDGLRRLGFVPLAAEAYASPTVTAAYLPAGVRFAELSQHLEDEFRVQVSGGQGPLKGKLLRIGHMGYIAEGNVTYLLEAIEAALRRCRSPEAT